ncbi:ferredoxin [Amycolatopsis acidiphila]|uniref:Ferredoxin n=1 Tax=Amycolatopsis acidiphila TaxID=715473 RepID=A0A557ZVC3_9PSEU|nr:ferredoxin [Amycolatopsis acidiphila]TVT15967.1 ferredoxin [Amycolatopsis acidiphila]UIJ58298.1 ferredoxin [Amycolatopsis acidiphila]GHG95740.1 ferredoxin [Amycolatopsis acidiphila]
MRVDVDRDLCEANELCAAFAPAVFELDDEDELLVKQPEVPQEEVERVTQAVAACPRNALFIRD